MSALLLASVLALLGALLGLALRGVPAADQLRAARIDLAQRRQALSATLERIRPVSWAELAAHEADTRDLGRLVEAQLSLLLDPNDPPKRPDLAAVLAASKLPALAQGQVQRAQVEQLAVASSGAASTLAVLLAALEHPGIHDLEQLETSGSERLSDLPELVRERFELVLVAEVPAAVALLEELTPQPGDPVLSVAASSLRRILPGLWPDEPSGLSSPPVRLWVRVEALTRAGDSQP